MHHNIFEFYKTKLIQIITENISSDIPLELLDKIAIDPPRDEKYGDFSTNAAMILSKIVKKNPKELAKNIKNILEQSPEITHTEVAGPGFLNFSLHPKEWLNQIKVIKQQQSNYGLNDSGKSQIVNIEFVSANPTGPLTAGHARGAIFGDALAHLLEKNGYKVIREYYINDAGGQVDTLARSTFLRYQEALGHDIGEIPSGLYPGEYLKTVGESIKHKDADKWLNQEESQWLPVFRETAVKEMMSEIQTDLEALDIKMDFYTSEKKLVEAGAVDKAFKKLQDESLIYEGILPPPKGKPDENWEPREQVLFKASQFGDDQDRPLKKSDGSWTYFANDIAYHYDKFLRCKANELIDVLGADHGGYIKRIKASTKAITSDQCAVDVKICQLVHLMDKGVPIKMSKRSGNFVTLKEIMDKVGKDVIRFIMLTRSNDQALEFDFAKVIEQSKDNPVFYVQYANARCHSILRHALAEKIITCIDDLNHIDHLKELEHPDFQLMIKKLAQFPRIIYIAGKAHEPHRIATYLQELAAEFHGLWHKGRDNAALKFIQTDQLDATKARLILINCITIVIGVALNILGVKPMTEM